MKTGVVAVAAASWLLASAEAATEMDIGEPIPPSLVSPF